MALVSMKQTAEEAKEAYPTADDGDQGDQYPWGLRLNLCEDDLAKLGISQAPKVGTELMLVAKVRVTGRSEYESEEGGATRSEANTSWQITDMQVGDVPEASDSATKLYG